jgi:hypothetical protein
MKYPSLEKIKEVAESCSSIKHSSGLTFKCKPYGEGIYVTIELHSKVTSSFFSIEDMKRGRFRHFLAGAIRKLY